MEFARLLFPDFSLIACGFLLCRYTALDRSVWDKVESLVYYFLFPALLFQSIVRSPLDLGNASSMMAAGLLLGLSGIGLSYLLPRVPGLRGHIDPRAHAGAAQVAFRFNSYIGLALAERLAGPAGLQLLAVLIGVCVPLFNVAAVWPMARHAQTGLLPALVRNPLIIATFLGLACNLAGFTLPDWLAPTVARIGASSIPLGLMAAGAGMHLVSLARSKVLTASLLAIRHAITPVVAWGLVRLLRLDASQAAALLIFSALPTSSSCYVLASRMGYDGGYVAGLVTLSAILGVLSLTFALGVLL